MSHNATLINGSWDKGDALHYNPEMGCTLYEHPSLDKILVPYLESGLPNLNIEVPVGYVKTADIPTGDYLGNVGTSIRVKTGTPDEYDILQIPFWSSDGFSFDVKTYSDLVDANANPVVTLLDIGDTLVVNGITTHLLSDERVPVLEDGLDDVLGLGITNPATGYGHNDAETLLKQQEVPELYAVSQEFVVNPWYDGGGLPVSYEWSVITADYEDMHYWFTDIFSKDPIKFNSLIYKEQQTGSDLDRVYKFVKDKYLRSEDGQTLLDENDTPIIIQ